MKRTLEIFKQFLRPRILDHLNHIMDKKRFTFRNSYRLPCYFSSVFSVNVSYGAQRDIFGYGDVQSVVFDGPNATVKMNCCTFYLRDGYLHKDDGPAYVTNKAKAYYKNGVIQLYETDKVMMHFHNGVLHRDDEPAVYSKDGQTSLYFTNGKLSDGISVITPDFRGSIKDGKYFNDKGPAIVGKNVEIWFENGKIHKIEGPAAVINQTKYYLVNGLLHREDGPAIFNSFSEYWYFHGLLHREGGPAVKKRDMEIYYKHGLKHRTDGPAVKVHPNHSGNNYIYGKYCTYDGVTPYLKIISNNFI